MFIDHVAPPRNQTEILISCNKPVNLAVNTAVEAMLALRKLQNDSVAKMSADFGEREQELKTEMQKSFSNLDAACAAEEIDSKDAYAVRNTRLGAKIRAEAAR